MKSGNSTKNVAKIIGLSSKCGLKQCFSTGGPLSYFGCPPSFFHFVKNHNFSHKFYSFYKKSTLYVAKVPRNNKINQVILTQLKV